MNRQIVPPTRILRNLAAHAQILCPDLTFAPLEGRSEMSSFVSGGDSGELAFDLSGLMQDSNASAAVCRYGSSTQDDRGSEGKTL
jgi:hypothetical protein